MNERIFELAKNDLIHDEYTEFGWQECHYYRFDPDELQKFAELIVRECAEIIESQDVDPSFKNRLRMSWAVKQHFGVE
jgi:hypothetical protein